MMGWFGGRLANYFQEEVALEEGLLGIYAEDIFIGTIIDNDSEEGQEEEEDEEVSEEVDDCKDVDRSKRWE